MVDGEHRSAANDEINFPTQLEELADLPVLRSLLRINHAVMQANFFDEALEVIAEQTLLILGAASAAISRWEPRHDMLRTLINVGSFTPKEQRWPENELQCVTEDRYVTGLLHQGRPYAVSIDDENLDPAENTWLLGLGKESELAVPVMHKDAVWGELWVTGAGGRRFGSDDLQLLQAIAAYAAVAIGRSELFSRTWRHAHQDPLTGLANRRELDELFHREGWEAEAAPTFLVGDVDGFKSVNDRHGHAAGDALLCALARVLEEVAASVSGALVVRLGGDEFCAVLPHSTLRDAQRFAQRVDQSNDGAFTMSWGAAAFSPRCRTGPELLAVADAALLDAKSLGPQSFGADISSPEMPPRGSDRRNTGRPFPARRGADRLVARVVEEFDANPPSSTAAALAVLAQQTSHTFGAAAWSVLVTTEGGRALQPKRWLHNATDHPFGRSLDGEIDSRTGYLLANYPAAAHAVTHGATYLAAHDLDDSDPAEIALLHRYGYRAVLALGVVDSDRSYLVKIYTHTGHHELNSIAAEVRVLAKYCLSAVSPTRPTKPAEANRWTPAPPHSPL